MDFRPYPDGDKPAVILHPSGTVVSFAELDARANRLAHFFRAAGLQAGDTIAVIVENNEHFHTVTWAARRCGLYYTPINTHLTAFEAAYIVDDSRAKAVVGSKAMQGVCQKLVEHLPGALPPLLLIADDDLQGWQRYPECVADMPTTSIADESEGDLLAYSSGTTGRPKGIRRVLSGLSPAEAPNPLAPLFSALHLDGNSVYLSPAPLYHTAPAAWSTAIQALGATVVVMEKFDAEQALHCIDHYGVTHGQFVPTMFVRMLKLPAAIRAGYRLSTLQRVVHAAAPCPPEVKRQMIEWWGSIIDEFYSSSEGAGITFITADEWLAHTGSVGRPLLGTAHILGEDGEELPVGEVGDIWFEGGLSFSYLNDDTKTASAWNTLGWSSVGDVGYLDSDGYLYLTDRRHHMIISGGVNIYPQEVENLLVTHPKVLDAAVFGIPDAAMGQSVKAVVQPVDPAEPTADLGEELITWLRERLAHYKCPRSISFEAQLPRADTGKLFKQGLIDKYGRPVTRELAT